MHDPTVGKRIVPIVPDEARTFGMEGIVPAVRHLQLNRQLYRPQDADQFDVLSRKRKTGQMLQEGINEAAPRWPRGWRRRRSYSTWNVEMVPFYIFYSMFGFRRVGDLAWAAGDMRARDFFSAARPAARR